MNIYTAEVAGVTGKRFLIAVESDADLHKEELRTVATMLLFMPYAAVRLHNVKRSNRRITKRMFGVKGCYQTDDDGNRRYWAWEATA